jgi:hypothetical protein
VTDLVILALRDLARRWESIADSIAPDLRPGDRRGDAIVETNRRCADELRTILDRTTGEACPVCLSRATFRLPDDWRERVEAGGEVPIVECGNPWHYVVTAGAEV